MTERTRLDLFGGWRLVTLPLLLPALGACIAVQPYLSAVVSVALVLVIICLSRPDVAVVATVVSACGLRWLDDTFIHISTSVIDATPPVFAALALLSLLLRRRRFLLSHAHLVVVSMSAFVLTGLASALANHISLAPLLESLRLYCGYFLLFFAVAALGRDDRWLRRVVGLLLVIVAAQLPVQIWQIASHHWQGGDWAVGTLATPGADPFGAAVLMMACTAIGIAAESRSRLLRLAAGVLVAEALVELILSESKFGVMLLPVALGIMVMLRPTKRRVAGLIIGAFAGWLALATLAPMVIPGSPMVDMVRNPLSSISSYEANSATIWCPPPRICVRWLSQIRNASFAWHLLDTNPARMLVGYGPGSATGSFTPELRGSLFNLYDPVYGPSFADTQLSAALLEYGLLGTVLYGVPCLIGLRRAIVIRASKDTTSLWRGVATGYCGVAFVALASLVYAKVWTANSTACILWFLTATICVVDVRTQDALPRPGASQNSPGPGDVSGQGGITTSTTTTSTLAQVTFPDNSAQRQH